MAKAVHHHKRPDGSEVRITAVDTSDPWRRSVDLYAHRRTGPDQPWTLLNNRPHPDWRAMSVEEYKQRGRPELLQFTTFAERVLATNEARLPAPPAHQGATHHE